VLRRGKQLAGPLRLTAILAREDVPTWLSARTWTSPSSRR